VSADSPAGRIDLWTGFETVEGLPAGDRRDLPPEITDEEREALEWATATAKVLTRTTIQEGLRAMGSPVTGIRLVAVLETPDGPGDPSPGPQEENLAPSWLTGARRVFATPPPDVLGNSPDLWAEPGRIEAIVRIDVTDHEPAGILLLRFRSDSGPTTDFVLTGPENAIELGWTFRVSNADDDLYPIDIEALLEEIENP